MQTQKGKKMDDLISRQAAIDAMKNMYQAAEKWGWEATDDVIKARAESCMASLIEMKLRIEKLPSAQQWIPCSDSLPAVGVNVLVCYKLGQIRYVSIGELLGDGEFHGYDDEYLSKEGRKRKAVAWMPLPEPIRLDGE